MNYVALYENKVLVLKGACSFERRTFERTVFSVIPKDCLSTGEMFESFSVCRMFLCFPHAFQKRAESLGWKIAFEYTCALTCKGRCKKVTYKRNTLGAQRKALRLHGI